jgi:hypothetical protein
VVTGPGKNPKKEKQMAGRNEMLAGVTLLLGLHGAPAEMKRMVAPPVPFTHATVSLERNVTDGDDEVVFEVDGGEDGLSKLTVTAPNGKVVVEFASPGTGEMGVRQFRFESPEPLEGAKVRQAYPAGVYTFVGTTPLGEKLESKATLSHNVPGSAKGLSPKNEAEVSPQNLTIAWTPAKDAAAHIVVVEQEEMRESITTRLPGTAQKFVVPAGFLRPGKEYRLGLGTLGRDGNAAYVEASFTTTGGAAGAE